MLVKVRTRVNDVRENWGGGELDDADEDRNKARRCLWVRKRWEDNMEEWTGLEFAKSQRAVENRGKWRRLFVKSSVVPPTTPAVKE